MVVGKSSVCSCSWPVSGRRIQLTQSNWHYPSTPICSVDSIWAESPDPAVSVRPADWFAQISHCCHFRWVNELHGMVTVSDAARCWWRWWWWLWWWWWGHLDELMMNSNEISHWAHYLKITATAIVDVINKGIVLLKSSLLDELNSETLVLNWQVCYCAPKRYVINAPVILIQSQFKLVLWMPFQISAKHIKLNVFDNF